MSSIPLRLPRGASAGNARMSGVPTRTGFIAAISEKRAGKLKDPLRRVMSTCPSSSGSLSASSASRANSGNSSKKRTPRWANVTSPGRGGDPPPTSATVDAVWWASKRPLRKQALHAVEETRGAPDARHFQGFLRVQRRHDPRHTSGKHGLPHSRGSHHQQVMTTRRCDLKRTFGSTLPRNVREIGL